MIDDRPGVDNAKLYQEWKVRLEQRAKEHRFTPIMPYPPPLPGEEDKKLVCDRCGTVYTMREFRVYSWQESSPLCVACDSEYSFRYFEEVLTL